MKISVVTPHGVHNYGAVLQANALYSYLSSQGYTVFMQDFPPHTGSAPASIKEKVYVTLRNIGRSLYKKELKEGYDNFEKFISRFNLTNDCDLPLYIVGSDQVWNPQNLEGVFSLDFASENSRKISYAASMGVRSIPEEKEPLFIESIARLSYLSAREQRTADEITRISGRPCSVELDPTLLCGKDFWHNQSSEINVKKPYVLLYLLHIPENTTEIIKKVKKDYPSCDILLIDQDGCKGWAFPGVKSVRNAGPAEFLWLFENAQMIVTSSFHGTAFSIIFEKQFVSLINPASPDRISNLLKTAGLEKYGNTGDSDYCKDTIDYDAVKSALETEVNKSKEYLKRSIEV